MGKWLTKFLTEYREPVPDKPDILPSVSGMSGCTPKNSFQNEGPADSGATLSRPSLEAGWVVAYIDRQGKLCGGWGERDQSTVKQCHGTGQDCQVEFSDGRLIPLRAVRTVGQTNAEGRLIAAWTVREHGYDGQGGTR